MIPSRIFACLITILCGAYGGYLQYEVMTFINLPLQISLHKEIIAAICFVAAGLSFCIFLLLVTMTMLKSRKKLQRMWSVMIVLLLATFVYGGRLEYLAIYRNDMLMEVRLNNEYRAFLYFLAGGMMVLLCVGSVVLASPKVKTYIRNGA